LDQIARGENNQWESTKFCKINEKSVISHGSGFPHAVDKNTSQRSQLTAPLHTQMIENAEGCPDNNSKRILGKFLTELKVKGFNFVLQGEV